MTLRHEINIGINLTSSLKSIEVFPSQNKTLNFEGNTKEVVSEIFNERLVFV